MMLLLNNFILNIHHFRKMCQLQIKLENKPFSQTLEFPILVLKYCLPNHCRPGSFLGFLSLHFNTSVTSLNFTYFSYFQSYISIQNLEKKYIKLFLYTEMGKFQFSSTHCSRNQNTIAPVFKQGQ